MVWHAVVDSIWRLKSWIFGISDCFSAATVFYPIFVSREADRFFGFAIKRQSGSLFIDDDGRQNSR